MYISLNTNQYDINNVIISEKTKNNKMTNISIEKYFNKIKCIFDNNDYNNNTVFLLKNIEKKLLERYTGINRDSVYRIGEQLENKFIKIFDDNYISIKRYKSIKFVLKVSGIWSSQNEYGLTFRFFLTPIIED